MAPEDNPADDHEPTKEERNEYEAERKQIAEDAQREIVRRKGVVGMFPEAYEPGTPEHGAATAAILARLADVLTSSRFSFEWSRGAPAAMIPERITFRIPGSENSIMKARAETTPLTTTEMAERIQSLPVVEEDNDEADRQDCETCNGRGLVRDSIDGGTWKCDDCNGSGKQG